MSRPTNCPKCKSEKVKRLVYGHLIIDRLPFWKRFLRRSPPRDWIGGGCCIHPDSHAWYCAKCEHHWGNYHDERENRQDENQNSSKEA